MTYGSMALSKRFNVITDFIGIFLVVMLLLRFVTVHQPIICICSMYLVCHNGIVSIKISG